jgi:hypothetical protein
MSKKNEIFDIIVKLKHETMKAVLVDSGGEEAWLPKELIEMERNKDGTWTISAPTWLLEDKGLV